MIQRSFSLGNTEKLSNISDSTQELTKITIGMCSEMRSTLTQYFVLAINTTGVKNMETIA